MAGMAGIGGTGGIRMPGELPGATQATGLGRLAPAEAPGAGAGFSEALGSLVDGVNQIQHRSDDTFRAFLRGQAELHDVALASHEASIAMRLTSEIRNQLIDAYREVMRMSM